MGCIKPPLNVTDPSPRSANRLAFALGSAAIDGAMHGRVATTRPAPAHSVGRLGHTARLMSRIDYRHIFNYTEKAAGKFSGYHHDPNPPSDVKVESFTVDVRTGHALVDLRIRVPGESELKKQGTHSMYNPEWSGTRVLEEIESAFDNQSKAPTKMRDGSMQWSGISRSGTMITGYADSEGRILTGYPVVRRG